MRPHSQGLVFCDNIPDQLQPGVFWALIIGAFYSAGRRSSPASVPKITDSFNCFSCVVLRRSVSDRFIVPRRYSVLGLLMRRRLPTPRVKDGRLASTYQNGPGSSYESSLFPLIYQAG